MGWVGVLFGLEALGSFAGGLVHAFWMAGRFSAVETLDAARAALHTAKARGVNHVALEAKFREAWF